VTANKQVRPKHVPLRTCVICRKKTDKRRLTRIVRTSDEGVVVDLTGKRNGRGAYICDTLPCWEEVLQSKILDRALLTEITTIERTSLEKHKTLKEFSRG